MFGLEQSGVLEKDFITIYCVQELFAKDTMEWELELIWTLFDE